MNSKKYRELFKKVADEVREYQRGKDYAKFRKISTHEHVGDGADFEKYLEVMERFNIERVFLMPTGHDYRREELAFEAVRKYPEKFTTFAVVNEVGKGAEEHLRAALRRGAKGLKLLFWHPIRYEENRVAMDGDEVVPFFEICDKAGVPVLAHMSIANYSEHQEQLAGALERFPRLAFIIPHYLGAAPKLDIVGEMLDKYPNLYSDVSMGGGKNRYAAFVQGFRRRFRDFFKKYHDRLFWGVDLFIGSGESGKVRFYNQRIEHDMNMLDEVLFHSPYYTENPLLRGLNLADWILEDVFYNNAKRVLGHLM